MEEADIDAIQFYTGAGCEKCHGTGYKWRLGIHEVLIVEEYLEPLIMAWETANTMNAAAKQHGMVTIVQDGLLKAALWETTLEEAFKLI
jgi:type II secretory ATPase GspE/PulE/Tfp pilus assembly ATPase PilB-like protein